MRDYAKRDTHLHHAARSSRFPRQSVPTRYEGTIFRSRLEARWAAFFDIAGVGWEYEPDEHRKGWWPDMRVTGLKLDGKKYSVLAEIKPVAFSPISVDPAFNKALGRRWRLMLGYKPEGDYIGFVASFDESGGLRTIGVRLTDDGIEGAPLGLCEYGGGAERMWSQASTKITNAGVSSAINSVIEANMGKELFHFDNKEPEAG